MTRAEDEDDVSALRRMGKGKGEVKILCLRLKSDGMAEMMREKGKERLAGFLRRLTTMVWEI